MLRVLARTATGQPLSVYTNILTGPRRRARAEARASQTAPTSCISFSLTTDAANCWAGSLRRFSMHPLRRLSERVSGLPVDRWPRIRQRVSRARWCGADAGATRARTVRRAPAGQQPLWRLPRSVSSQNRHSADAARAPAAERRGDRRSFVDPLRHAYVRGCGNATRVVPAGRPPLARRSWSRREARMGAAAAWPTQRMDGDA